MDTTILNELYKSINIAEELDDSKLQKIGDTLRHAYDEAESERADWLSDNEKAMKLASQHSEGAKWAGEKTFDVMYPIISGACIQFAARAYPNIIKGKDVVKCDTPGFNQPGVEDRANRMAKFLNYQLLNLIPSWPDQTDQMLYALPVMGSHFRKTYYSDTGIISENVPAADLVIPYKAKSLNDASIVTQKIVLKKNDVISRQRTGMYLNIKPQDLGFTDDDKDEQTFLEHHCWLDLDDDDFKEPYVVVTHEDTNKVMRITARFNVDDVRFNEKDEVYYIKPVQYFTRYIFMPAFDGGVYGMGFGRLLGPLNDTVNAVINQLLDAGALRNRQGGFIGMDFRLGSNESMYFKLGEWKRVRFSGDDIRKNMVPLPTNEPSSVLFQLLGVMVDAAKEMSSVSELLSGEQKQANVPASTTQALIEQGLKVFSSIYQRIWRSLKQEVSLIRDLNFVYPNDDLYMAVINQQASMKEDFFPDDFDVVPIVDETEITELQKVAKATSLLDMKGQGYNDAEIDRRYMDAIGIENIETIIPEQKEPDPAQEAELEYTLAKADKERSEAELNREKVNSEVMEQNVSQAGANLDQQKLIIEKARAANDIKLAKQQTTAGAQRNLKEMNPSSKRREQKQPYREVGLKSDNVRRKEQSES